MSLSSKATEILTRALPKDKIHTRPGKAGMEFAYITPDFVIETLNEAFGGHWGTRIVFQNLYDNVVVVGLELNVPAEDGTVIAKQQFGSCEITRGLGTGEAFKGAASDALKKCATLLGVGLELYKDEEPAAPVNKFQPPQAPSRPPVAPPKAPFSTGPSRPPIDKETRVFPPSTPGAPTAPPRPSAPPIVKPAVPPPARNGLASPGVASVPKPAPPKAPVSVPMHNPFSNSVEAAGPNSTQMNAMTNLANRKGLSPNQLIALAGVVDGAGSPVQSFEELTREQAIQVIKAAQL